MAIVTSLARDGARVILNGRSEASVIAARAEVLAEVPGARWRGLRVILPRPRRQEFEKEYFESVRPTSLIKRFATTQEVANLVAYVCSPLSSASNGVALRVDVGVVRACF